MHQKTHSFSTPRKLLYHIKTYLIWQWTREFKLYLGGRLQIHAVSPGIFLGKHVRSFGSMITWKSLCFRWYRERVKRTTLPTMAIHCSNLSFSYQFLGKVRRKREALPSFHPIRYYGNCPCTSMAIAVAPFP